jgi:hypothetical protein
MFVYAGGGNWIRCRTFISLYGGAIRGFATIIFAILSHQNSLLRDTFCEGKIIKPTLSLLECLRI